MMLDKKSIDMLLSLDDQRLSFIIKKLATDAGIPTDTLNLGAEQLNKIRSALSVATENDILRATELLQNFKNGKV